MRRPDNCDMSGYKRLGEIMVERGLLSEEQLKSILELRSNSALRFGELVVQQGLATEWDIACCLAEQYDLPVVNPDELHPHPRAVHLVPAVFALRRLVLPYELTATELHCAVADPIDVSISDLLSNSTHKTVRLVVAPETALQAAIARAYALPVSVIAANPEIPKRRRKIDPQTDRVALLDELRLRAQGGRG